MRATLSIEHLFFTVSKEDFEISVNVELKDNILNICTYRIDYILPLKAISEVAIFQHSDIERVGLVGLVIDRLTATLTGVKDGLYN